MDNFEEDDVGLIINEPGAMKTVEWAGHIIAQSNEIDEKDLSSATITVAAEPLLEALSLLIGYVASYEGLDDEAFFEMIEEEQRFGKLGTFTRGNDKIN